MKFCGFPEPALILGVTVVPGDCPASTVQFGKEET